MTRSLAGKTALVTGASAGLGAHFSQVLAREGAHVIMAARREQALAEGVAAIQAQGGSAAALALDVSDAASVAAAESALSEVDILVNNAGAVRSGTALEQSEEDWDAIVDVNLKGAFLVAQAVARAMRAHGRGGSIVNIASILGIRQAAAVLPYAVSKAGVIQMTKTLAFELARFGIRTNAIAPGYFSTDLNAEFLETESGQAMLKRIPQRRFGNLEDLDGPLLLLAGDGSAYMNGAVIVVDGGHLVSTL